MYLPGAAPRPVQTPRPVPAPPAAPASLYIAHLANMAPCRRAAALRCAPICAELCPNVTIYYIAPPPGPGGAAPPPERTGPSGTDLLHCTELRRVLTLHHLPDRTTLLHCAACLVCAAVHCPHIVPTL